MKKCYCEGPTFKLCRVSEVPLLNFEGVPGVPLLNFKVSPGSRVPGSQDPGVLFPLLHHAPGDCFCVFYVFVLR